MRQHQRATPDRPLVSMEVLPESGLVFELTRKPIKRAYLRVRAKDGQITVNAPLTLPLAYIHDLITQHRDWILKHQTRIQQQTKIAPADRVPGQMLDVLGESLELRCHHKATRAHTECSEGVLHIHSRTVLSPPQLQARVNAYLWDQLHAILRDRLDYWSVKIGVSVTFIGIKRMKTRWGSCNIRDRRIWINLELARMPLGCIDLVLVHELVHLHERGHNARFYAFMDHYLPNWRAWQEQLQRTGMAGL